MREAWGLPRSDSKSSVGMGSAALSGRAVAGGIASVGGGGLMTSLSASAPLVRSASGSALEAGADSKGLKTNLAASLQEGGGASEEASKSLRKVANERLGSALVFEDDVIRAHMKVLALKSDRNRAVHLSFNR
jgi:hypothetical protein